MQLTKWPVSVYIASPLMDSPHMVAELCWKAERNPLLFMSEGLSPKLDIYG